MRHHRRARRRGDRRRHGVEQLLDGALELGLCPRVETAADRGRADRVQDYLKLWPIARPKEISPLSMRMLNPQSGFVHTQAL